MDKWSPTMMLRFVSRSGVRILQQCWQRFHTNEAGHISHWDQEWRDVPYWDDEERADPWADENQRIYDEKESRISGDDKRSL